MKRLTLKTLAVFVSTQIILFGMGFICSGTLELKAWNPILFILTMFLSIGSSVILAVIYLLSILSLENGGGK